MGLSLVDTHTANLLFGIHLAPCASTAFSLIDMSEPALRIADPYFIARWDQIKGVDENAGRGQRKEFCGNAVFKRRASDCAIVRRSKHLCSRGTVRRCKNNATTLVADLLERLISEDAHFGCQ